MTRAVLIVLVVAVAAGVCLAGVCPNCKGQVPDRAGFCPSCGVKLAAACSQCGTALAPGAKFCPQCGQKVEASPASAPAPAPAPAGQAGEAEAASPPEPASRPSGPFDPQNEEADRMPLTFGAFTNEQVQRVIQLATERILSLQRLDGAWDPILMYTSDRSGIGTAPPPPGQRPTPMHQVGVTAMAVYALLEGGQSWHDGRIKKALDWLQSAKTDMTYDVAFRANAYQAAVRQGAAQYRKPLQQDVKLLIEKSNHGGYSYYLRDGLTRDQFDNSNSQYALLGVWAAAQVDVEVPARYWQEAWGHWRFRQNADGGWGYDVARKSSAQGTATMATAGLASLFICYDQLYGADSIQCGAVPPNAGTIDRGMKWLEKNFAASFNPAAVQSIFYHLYGIERVALASGYKYFGGIEWYRHGTKILLAPDAERQWGGVWEPAYTILFLARGRNPVLFNKLKRPGDWNNRPRELAHLTRWVSRTLERQISWQIVDVDSESADWHDAPILYIAGAKAPVFTDEQVARLQRYVREGGTILSVAECGGEPFRTGMRKLYTKLFPDCEIILAPKTHEIYSKEAGFPIPGGPPMFLVSNGARVLAYHSDLDLALDWQTNKHVTRPDSFQVAFNIARLVTGQVKLMRHRAQSHWPDARALAAAAPADPPLKLARLKFSGHFDPEPLALERFRQVMAVNDNLRVEVVGPIPIDQLAAQKVRFAHLAGVGPFNLTAPEIAALKAFVEGGGTLLIEAVGASVPFAQQAEKLIPAICPNRPLVELPPDSELLKLPGLEIKSVTYGPRTTQRLRRTGSAPLLKVVLFDDVPRLYLSREDITTSLLGCPYASLDGYSNRSALCLLRNMLSLACRAK